MCKILTVGKKGREQLKRDFADSFVGHVDLTEVKRVGYADAQGVAADILSRFDAGEFDVATLFFSKFQSVISQIPTEQQIIPATFEQDEDAGSSTVYDYEPEESEILADLLPRGQGHVDRDLPHALAFVVLRVGVLVDVFLDAAAAFVLQLEDEVQFLG